MQNNYTENQIIRYLYNELNPLEEEGFRIAMDEDFFLRERVQEYVSMYEMFDGITEVPHPSSIDLIMEYSFEKSGMENAFA